MADNRDIRRGGAKEVGPGALSETAGLAERVDARERPGRTDAVPATPANGASLPDTPVIGYASCFRSGNAGSREIEQQTSTIARECKRRGLRLIEVVGEREPATGKGLARPGLGYALDRIQTGDAEGLVVAELSRITSSAAELGTLIEWFESSSARLVAAGQALDTASENGRLAAQMLIEVSRWERTRHGLEAARKSGKSTGRGAVADDAALSERITQMRAQGMTLQAIADRLNAEGVPTIRGGAKWRHSSVQAAAGYRRTHHPLRGVMMGQRRPQGGSS
jgi:DNA invertase Pin-like site-specific DNA recombinase